VGKKKYQYGPIPLPPPLSIPLSNQPGGPGQRPQWGPQTHVCDILSAEMRLVATKLFLCMAVVTWYGFKPAKKVATCHTGTL